MLAFGPHDWAEAGVSPDSKRVFVGAADGYLRSFRAADGHPYWKIDTGERVEAAPLVDDKWVYVGSLNGQMYRIASRSGRVDWTYDSGAAIVSEATFDGGRLFFSNDKNTVFALDAETGEFLWRKSRRHQDPFTITGQAGVLASEGRLFVGYSDGTLMSLAPEDGATAWSKNLGRIGGRLGDIDHVPVLHDGMLYATAFRGGVYALDPSTGEVQWRHDVEGGRGPVPQRSRLYITTARREVQCLRAEDGTVVWRTVLPRGSLSKPVLAGNWLFVSNDHYLAVLSAASGEILRVWPSVEGIAAAPAIGGGRLFVMSNGGQFHALSIRNY